MQSLSSCIGTSIACMCNERIESPMIIYQVPGTWYVTSTVSPIPHTVHHRRTPDHETFEIYTRYVVRRKKNHPARCSHTKSPSKTKKISEEMFDSFLKVLRNANKPQPSLENRVYSDTDSKKWWTFEPCA